MNALNVERHSRKFRNIMRQPNLLNVLTAGKRIAKDSHHLFIHVKTKNRAFHVDSKKGFLEHKFCPGSRGKILVNHLKGVQDLQVYPLFGI